MPLKVNCPSGCQFEMPVVGIGMTVRCPVCRTLVRIEARPPVRYPSSNAETAASDSVPISIDTRSVSETTQPQELLSRAVRARQDKVLISRFVGAFLVFAAAVNISPAIYHWYSWSATSLTESPPRWTWLLTFVAAIHVIYAVFVFQIADWSALKAVSLALLAVAGVFGFVAVALVLGNGSDGMSRFLQLPFDLFSKGQIWCVAMLLLSVIASYISGREALGWQRMDQLFARILNDSNSI